MVASALSPAPVVATTVPSPKVSWDTRCPTSSAIADETFPVARGGGPEGSRLYFTALEDVYEGLPSFFHSRSAEGISSRKRDAGLYFGVPKVNRYSAREI